MITNQNQPVQFTNQNQPVQSTINQVVDKKSIKNYPPSSIKAKVIAAGMVFGGVILAGAAALALSSRKLFTGKFYDGSQHDIVGFKTTTGTCNTPLFESNQTHLRLSDAIMLLRQCLNEVGSLTYTSNNNICQINDKPIAPDLKLCVQKEISIQTDYEKTVQDLISKTKYSEALDFIKKHWIPSLKDSTLQKIFDQSNNDEIKMAWSNKDKNYLVLITKNIEQKKFHEALDLAKKISYISQDYALQKIFDQSNNDEIKMAAIKKMAWGNKDKNYLVLITKNIEQKKFQEALDLAKKLSWGLQDSVLQNIVDQCDNDEIKMAAIKKMTWGNRDKNYLILITKNIEQKKFQEALGLAKKLNCLFCRPFSTNVTMTK